MLWSRASEWRRAPSPHLQALSTASRSRLRKLAVQAAMTPEKSERTQASHCHRYARSFARRTGTQRGHPRPRRRRAVADSIDDTVSQDASHFRRWRLRRWEAPGCDNSDWKMDHPDRQTFRNGKQFRSVVAPLGGGEDTRLAEPKQEARQRLWKPQLPPPKRGSSSPTSNCSQDDWLVPHEDLGKL